MRERELFVTLRCIRRDCGTRVDMRGPKDDVILNQVLRWGSTCPKCGDDLNVISKAEVPALVVPAGVFLGNRSGHRGSHR